MLSPAHVLHAIPPVRRALEELGSILWCVEGLLFASLHSNHLPNSGEHSFGQTSVDPIHQESIPR